MNRLIFIEGVSGVGKTTTAASLRNKLQDMGFVCFLEGDYDNPLDPFGGTYPPAIPLTVFTEIYANCWRSFMEGHLKQKTRFILDGTLLHHQINDLIRNYHASNEDIANHLTILLQIVQPMNPILFYLTSRNVAQRLLLARESRGQSVPADDQIAFWESRKCIDLFVLEQLPVESQILYVDSGWNRAVELMKKQITNNLRAGS